jgi:hypothetical protein
MKRYLQYIRHTKIQIALSIHRHFWLDLYLSAFLTRICRITLFCFATNRVIPNRICSDNLDVIDSEHDQKCFHRDNVRSSSNTFEKLLNRLLGVQKHECKCDKRNIATWFQYFIIITHYPFILDFDIHDIHEFPLRNRSQVLSGRSRSP